MIGSYKLYRGTIMPNRFLGTEGKMGQITDCDECGQTEEDVEGGIYSGEDGMDFPLELESFDIESLLWDKDVYYCKECVKKLLIEELQEAINNAQKSTTPSKTKGA